MTEILCDTCGGEVQGGVRRYVGANGDDRIGCDDDHACAAVFAGRSLEERKLIDACRHRGDYLERAKIAEGTTS